ncbi:MAG TPA: PAS domain-containing protein, partial [Anaerolineales bacterium]|nr:PAS domain-containing protein [Anaerolineales bacterium]
MNVQFGITRKLALVLILFAALLLAGVGLLAYSSGRNSLRSATIAELLATAIEKEAALRSWVSEKEGDTTQLAGDPQVVKSTARLIEAEAGASEAREAYDLLFAKFEHHVNSGEFMDIFLMDPETGVVVIAIDPALEGKSKLDEPFFINGRNGPYVQNLYYSEALQGPAMTASAPVRGVDGQLLGVLAGRLDLAEMNAIITRRTGLRQADDAFLLNTAGQFVTQPRLLTDPAVLEEGVRTPAALSCLRGRSGLLESPDYRGIPAIIVYRWMPEHRMCLVVKLEEAEAYAPARAFGGTVAGFSALVLLAAAALATALSHTLTRPILRLQEGLMRFRGGERHLQLPVQAADELGALAHEFNRMAVSLGEKEEELRRHASLLEQKVTERTQALQRTVSQLQQAEQIGMIGSWEWFIPENRVVASEGLYKLMGVTAGEFGDTMEAFFERIHPDDVAQTYQAVESALKGKSTFEAEARSFRADGQLRHMYARGEAFYDTQGNPLRMIGIV